MKLLITTQIVDEQDPRLGFFCNWLQEFSTRFESIEVICLSEGPHALPENVHVHSLGKETLNSFTENSTIYDTVFRRIRFSFRFVCLAWNLRKRYDAVFVHMNPEYILLAGDQWRLFGKKVYLWYNHTVGSAALRLAAPFAKTIFHTSPLAFPARYKNAKLMPAGIDTDIFAPQSVARNRNWIYFQGRVAPAKRVHVLLEALRIVRKKDSNAVVTIVGPEDVVYGKRLREYFADLISLGAVTFLGPHKNEETPARYASHGVSVNLTAGGNFDKTVLEAMACETPVVVGSTAFRGVVPDAWVVSEQNPSVLADALARMLTLPEDAYHVLGKQERAAVVEKHSLAYLGKRLSEEITA